MRASFFLYIATLQIAFAVELSVLSYNIHALSPILAGDKPKQRIVSILEKSKDFDLIFFQENWIFSEEDLANRLESHTILRSKKSKFKPPIRGLLNKNGSGLSFAIGDTIPTLNSSEVSFDDCSGCIGKGSDCMATKGFYHVSIELSGGVIDLYNTHLDAGGAKSDFQAREKQLKKITDYIELNSLDNLIILAGDMNINLLKESEAHMMDYLTERLGFKMVQWYDDSLNYSLALDYILYRASDVLDISLISGGVDESLLGLSDHPPIKALFDIRKK